MCGSMHDKCGTANFVHSRVSKASGHRVRGYGDSTKNILIDGNDPHIHIFFYFAAKLTVTLTEMCNDTCLEPLCT